MIISKDFKEFLELLNKNKVKYLVVGGYAIAFHGYPRYTKDIDLWILMEKSNAESILKTLDEFGFSGIGITVEDLNTPETVIQLGYPPNRIDLITEVSGLTFEECYDKKIEITVEGTSVFFIDLESLKKNKKASGRHQDLADLENLE
jgi:predicted nucleotidyltransferase